MLSILQELIKAACPSSKHRIVYFSILAISGGFFYVLKEYQPAWLLQRVAHPTVIATTGALLVLSLCSVVYLLLLLNKKTPKFNMDEFTLHSEGYYTHPKYSFEICPECLHSTSPAIVPMSKSSGPWRCVGKGHTIPIKAACVGSDPPPRRTINGRR
jgi:hypothetical protein